MKVRIRDVAKAVGVSPATVSNALNGKAGVSPLVIEKIRAIADEMGYSMKGNRTEARPYVRLLSMKVHGQVVMDTQFFGELIEEIQRRCLEEKLELIISTINISTDKNWEGQIRDFCAEECAGLIVLGTELSTEHLERFRPCRSPLIVLDNACRHMHFNSVVMDNTEAGFVATKHLYEAGHRRIGFISSGIRFSNMTLRGYGYRNAMIEAENTQHMEEWPVRPTIEGAYEDMKAYILSGRKLPTAFFAGNDIMAIGAMRAMHENNIRVPEDVSIIGMDDTDLCLACSPQLTTIKVYRKEMGRVVVEMLLSVAPGQKQSVSTTTLSVDLVERGSVRKITGTEENET